MNRSLSLNWWSDKVSLNSRRHTGTHCRGRNMWFTSRAPSYTRANVTVCMHVCVCVSVCVRTGVQHVFAVSYQLLISLQQRGGEIERERARMHTQWEKVITVQWERADTKLSPISPSSHHSFCFARLLCFFPASGGKREQTSRSLLLWFTCVCVWGVYVWFNFYCLNAVGVDDFHFGFLGYFGGRRCRQQCQDWFLT